MLGVQCGIDDKVEIAINNGTTRKQRGLYKIYTTPSTNRMYFVMGGVRYYLEDFIRV